MASATRPDGPSPGNGVLHDPRRVSRRLGRMSFDENRPPAQANPTGRSLPTHGRHQGSTNAARSASRPIAPWAICRKHSATTWSGSAGAKPCMAACSLGGNRRISRRTNGIGRFDMLSMAALPLPWATGRSEGVRHLDNSASCVASSVHVPQNQGVPTCTGCGEVAPRQAPAASDGCPESVWERVE